MLAPSTASAQRPFAFRGIPLGMPLDNFRHDETARATPEPSVAACETDPEAGALGMTLRCGQSLAIACKWAHRDERGWHASQAVVDGAPAYDHVLRFVAMPGEASPRLYEMSFVVDARIAGDLTDALSSKYGRSRARRSGEGTMRVWDNAASSITLMAGSTPHTATLTYRLKDHYTWLQRVTDAWQSRTASLDVP